MRNRVIIAAVAVALLLGLAVLVQHWLFAEPDTRAVAGETGTGKATAAAGTGAPAGTSGGGSAAAETGAASALPAAPSVAEVSGNVERKAKDGDWAPLKVGDLLAEDDEIRTAPGARAVLKIDDGKVEVFERDQLAVSDITAAAAELLLRKGRIAAVGSGAGAPRALRIRAEGSDAVVETKGGRFAVYADGAGTVAVAADTKGVTLSAGGKTLDLDPATVAHVAPGAAPVIGPVATKVVMEVRWPEARSPLAKKETVVVGKAEPGSRVTVGGEDVIVSSDGTFKTSVPLDEGVNRVKVEVEDVTGKKGEATSPKIMVDTTSPRAKVHGEDLWKKKPGP
ncbi:MAG TPA: hypothetical protein VG389_03005 [Myxococcota bacterium]|jgi:hypothetical protein|nr:hypothetical protein [Myxococcota bacterium]